jgi:hypothetical protein
MPKRRRGGYLGGSTVIRASVGLLREKTKKHSAKVQGERDRLAAERAAFEQNQTPALIKANSPVVQKALFKHKTEQERSKRRAERKARRRLHAV